MTIERWTDERLNALATDIEGNKEAISELRISIVDLRTSGELLLQTAQMHQQNFEVSQRNIEGLQLDKHLFGEVQGIEPD